MIEGRVEVCNKTGSFTLVVYAENLRPVARIARDRCPGSAVGIAFPLELHDSLPLGLAPTAMLIPKAPEQLEPVGVAIRASLVRRRFLSLYQALIGSIILLVRERV